MAFNVKDHLISLKGKQYLPVAGRLVWFREDHPDWSITTEPVMIDTEKGYAIFKAIVTNAEGKALGSGTKMETARDFSDFVEKAETGSIGRALAVCGYGTQFAPELEEGERIVDTPQPMTGTPQRTYTASVGRGIPQQAESTRSNEKLLCSTEGCGKEITKGQAEYSSHTYGAPLCPSCQRQKAKEKTSI